MGRYETMCEEIVKAIEKAKEGNEELMKKAEETEKAGQIEEAYFMYGEIADIGFLDDIMETVDEITIKAEKKARELWNRMHRNAIEEMDSKPYSELTYGKYGLNGACCAKLRNAFDNGGLNLVSIEGEPKLAVSEYYRYYDEYDDEITHPEIVGTFYSDECPFCGKKLKRSEE